MNPSAMTHPRFTLAVAALVAVVAYTLTYLICFIWFGVPLRLLFSYLRWSWTGGGEIPAFINAVSVLVGFLALVLVWFAVGRRRSASPSAPPKP
jgi:NhaP-type Na+/H+ and K+/H+ antiporter